MIYGALEVEFVSLIEGTGFSLPIATITERVVDTLAIEAPLSMELTHKGVTYPLGITMRTPGEALDLTVGFLYSEGIIEHFDDIHKLSEEKGVISVEIRDNLEFDINSHRRQTLTSSACGVCGKESLTN